MSTECLSVMITHKDIEGVEENGGTVHGLFSSSAVNCKKDPNPILATAY